MVEHLFLLFMGQPKLLLMELSDEHLLLYLVLLFEGAQLDLQVLVIDGTHGQVMADQRYGIWRQIWTSNKNKKSMLVYLAFYLLQTLYTL